MTLQLLDESGRPISTTTPEILNAHGEEFETVVPMTTKDLGQERARIMLDIAHKNSPTEAVEKLQLDVLYHLALNILAHRIVNVGLGMSEENAIVEWNSSHAFAYEKEVQEHLTLTVEEWKTQFFNGELVYQAKKKS